MITPAWVTTRVAVGVVEFGYGVLSAGGQHGDAFPLMRPRMEEVRCPGIEFISRQFVPGLHLPCSEIHLDQSFIPDDVQPTPFSDEFGKLSAPGQRARYDAVYPWQSGQNDAGLVRKRGRERQVSSTITGAGCDIRRCMPKEGQSHARSPR